MEGIEIRMIDRENILYLIRGLEDFEKDKALRSGLAAGANVFKIEGKQRLRSRMRNPNGVKGNLLKSFTVRVKRSKLGALAGFKYGDEGGNHSWLADMGTSERKQKKTGRRTGTAKALSYWTDTRNEDYSKAMNKVSEGLERAVNRIKERRK